MGPKVSKQELISQILLQLDHELQALLQSARSAHEAATHQESKAEDSHDTRGLEASYLAGAQMARVELLKKTIVSYQFFQIREFKPTDPIDLGAYVELEVGRKRVDYFLAGTGGGLTISLKGLRVNVITPQAPLGEALMGSRLGDVVEVESPQGTREYEIVGIY